MYRLMFHWAQIRNPQQMLATEFKSIVAIHQDQVGVVFGMEGWLGARSSIYMIHTLAGWRVRKNHAIIFIDAASFGKLMFLCIKILKLGWDYTPDNKGHRKHYIQALTTEFISCMIRNKTKMSSLSFCSALCWKFWPEFDNNNNVFPKPRKKDLKCLSHTE